MKNKNIYWKLFSSTFTLSAFTFGGGYVIVPLMKKKFADQMGWISEDEMLELVAIGQSSPGAIAINAAVLVGWRVAGLPGALCGLVGTALPPLIILSLVCFFYNYIRDNRYVAAAMKGMQAGIAAVIANVVFSMAAPYFKKEKLPYLPVMVAAFAATWFFDVNVAIIIIACGALGALFSVISNRRKGGALK